MSRERRGLFVVEESAADAERFGCPMLVRCQQPNPVDGSECLWRCALGWAIFSCDEVARCRTTHAVSACWRLSSDRVAARMAASAMLVEHQAAAD